MLEPPFNEVVGLDACNFIKNRLQHRWFSVEFAKFLTSFITEHLQWLLLKGVKSLHILHFSQHLYSLMNFIET